MNESEFIKDIIFSRRWGYESCQSEFDFNEEQAKELKHRLITNNMKVKIIKDEGSNKYSLYVTWETKKVYISENKYTLVPIK